MSKNYEDARASLERLIEDLIRASAAAGWDGGDGLGEGRAVATARAAAVRDAARAERASRGEQKMASAGAAASNLAGFGMWGLAGSIISGVESLFGGGQEEPAAAPVGLWQPVKRKWAAGVDLRTDEGPFLADRDASGNWRPVGQAAAAAAQITLNVQALDARSLLERSGEIADAVRSALLNAHPLADVIAEI